MIDKYNAFISYRHAAEDSRIASEIQTQLERFRIPKEIRKKTGVKRFERIFRDKEELPITSDLNDDINKALEESDNLIVICSVRTAESIWVRKEIETFLRTHDKKHVFTVLVDGEPGDVIPEELLHDAVERKLPNGTTEVREEMIEPLSCDYRMGVKKARKIELPRLAASLLGCSYDELIQRRKQYQRRRIAVLGTIGGVVAAGAVGYLSWSLLQIQKNYDLAQFNYGLAQENLALAQANYETAQSNYMESLSNQSRYLASESGELLRNGDRLGAIQLALAALPSDETDRPIITDAEFALANALGTYRTPENGSMDAVWKYSTGHRILRFLMSTDDRHLAAVDNVGRLYIWNVTDKSTVRVFGSDTEKCRDLMFDGSGRIIICFDDKLALYDTDFETLIWSIPLEDGWNPPSSDRHLRMTEDYSEIVYNGGRGFIIIDEETGEIKERHDVSEELPEEAYWFNSVSILDWFISGDGKYIEIEGMSFEFARPVFILNRETGSWVSVEPEMEEVISSRYIDGVGMLITYEEDIYSSSVDIGMAQILREKNRRIAMIDPDTGSLLWICDQPYTQIGYGSQIVVVDVSLDGGESIPAVAVLFSDRCIFIDIYTGEVIATKEFPSSFIRAYVASSGKRLVAVLRDGTYAIIMLGDLNAQMTAYSFFAPGVDETDVYYSDEGFNCFLIEYDDGDYLIEYDPMFYDHDGIPVNGIPADLVVYDSQFADGRVLVFGGDMNLYCLDGGGSVLWTQSVEGVFPGYIKILGSSENGDFYLSNSNDISVGSSTFGDKIFRVDHETGRMDHISELDNSTTESTSMVNNVIYTTMRDSLKNYVVGYDTSSGEVTRIELDESASTLAFFNGFLVAPDGKHAALYGVEESLNVVYLLDLADGSSRRIICDAKPCIQWNETSDIIAISAAGNTGLYDVGGDELLSFVSSDVDVMNVGFADDSILVVYSSGTLARYNGSGEMISSIDVELMGGKYGEYIRFERYDDELFLVMDAGNGGSVVNVINLDDFKTRYIIYGYLGYDPEDGIFFSRSLDPVHGAPVIVCFERKEIKDLIAKGYEFLHGEVMSDEMKIKYGI